MLFQKILATQALWVNYIIAFSLFHFISSKGISQEIVANGSFETWPITGEWTTIDAGITVNQETLIFFDGASSARVSIQTQTQDIMDFRQTIQVVAGVDYTVSVRVFQTDNQATARLYVGGFTGIYSDETTVGAWQELTRTFIPTVSGPIQVGFRFYDVEANWTGGPSDILIDQFSITPTPGIIADQFEQLWPSPNNAGVGLPFDITICATNGTSVDVTYTNPITLNDMGSTATYTVFPLSPSTPSSGCVTYTITPTSVGDLSFDLGNGDFINIASGTISVEMFEIPSVAFSAEVYNSSSTPQSSSSALNDAWTALQGDSCTAIAGGAFEPVYGVLSYDTTTHIGTISGLVDMINGTSGESYTGNSFFRLVNMDGPIKGTHFTTNGGNLSANATTMQASAPKPVEISADAHFTENTGNLTARNAFAFSFDPPVSDFGVWVGDMETNPLGTNAEILLFHGDALLTQVPILTSSTLVEQMNATGTGCGSSETYPGCGNQATRWIEFSGGLVTDALIVVGDDEVGGEGLSEHMSFGGVTIGGTCSAVVLGEINWGLDTEPTHSGILVSWISPITAKVFIEKQDLSGKFVSTSIEASTEKWLDQHPSEGWNTYRLRWQNEDGQTGYSPSQRIFWSGSSTPLLYPNPARDFISISWQNKPTQYKIWNYQGQLIQSGYFQAGQGKLSVQSLPRGRYMCQLLAENKSEIIPFVVY